MHWPLFLIPLIAAFPVLGQATPTVKQAPPPGITVPSADAQELNSQLRTLGAEIANLRTTLANKPASLALLPDVEVFHKAVRYALDYGEFFKPAEINAAGSQLATGLQRSAELRALHPNWVAARGSVVRA